MSLARPTSHYSPVQLVKRSQECLLRALDSGSWYQREAQIKESVQLQEQLVQVLRKAGA